MSDQQQTTQPQDQNGNTGGVFGGNNQYFDQVKEGSLQEIKPKVEPSIDIAGEKKIDNQSAPGDTRGNEAAFFPDTQPTQQKEEIQPTQYDTSNNEQASPNPETPIKNKEETTTTQDESPNFYTPPTPSPVEMKVPTPEIQETDNAPIEPTDIEKQTEKPTEETNAFDSPTLDTKEGPTEVIKKENNIENMDTSIDTQNTNNGLRDTNMQEDNSDTEIGDSNKANDIENVDEEDEIQEEDKPEEIEIDTNTNTSSELVSKVNHLRKVINDIYSIQEKDTQEVLELIGSDNEKLHIVYEISHPENNGIVILKKQTDRVTETELSHTLAFQINEDNKLEVFLDDVSLYDEDYLQQKENKKMQVIDKLNKFTFLTEELLKKSEKAKAEEAELIQKRRELQDIFRNF